MIEALRTWVTALPDTARVIAAVVGGTVVLAGGLVDTRLRATANAKVVNDVEERVEVMETSLEHLEEDVDDVLCMLILEETGGNPLECVEDHRDRRR